MATQRENQDIKELQRGFSTLNTDVAVMKNDISYIKATSAKIETFLDENKPGIKTASILNNQILTLVIAAIIGAGMLYLASKGIN